MEITQLIHLLKVSEKSCRHPRNTLKTQLHFDYTNETPEGNEGLGEAGDCPKTLKDKIDMWLLIACLSCFITQCSLARGHFFMSDLYIPLPGSNSRRAVHPGNLDSRRPSRNEHLQTCCFSQTEAKPHTGPESVPGHRDSCGHHERSDLRPESEGWGFLLWIVLVSLQPSEPMSSHLSTKHFH